MRRELSNGLSVHITGGTDREGGGDGPLVVLLHGFGAPGDDLVPLHRAMDVPREVRFAFPEAPLDLVEHAGPAYAGARAWWMIDPELFEAAARGEKRDRTRMIPDGLVAAREQVMGALRELGTRLGVPPSRTLLGGFSQGAMLTMDVALHAEAPFAALALLSGTLISRDDWEPRLPALRGVPIVQSHGKDDPILPFDGAVALADLLRAAGAQHRWVEFRGGHAIPGPALSALERLVCDVAERAPTVG
jgi:phospholipase/carboxylesterase